MELKRVCDNGEGWEERGKEIQVGWGKCGVGGEKFEGTHKLFTNYFIFNFWGWICFDQIFVLIKFYTLSEYSV